MNLLEVQEVINMEKKEIDSCLSLIEHGSWDIAVSASDRLSQCNDPYCVKKLIRLLSNDKRDARDVAALALRDIRDNAAVKPLIDAINDPKNVNDNSTMVYALEELDCSGFFIEIFELAFSPFVDVFVAALSILENQKFGISNYDIEKAHLKIESAETADPSLKERLIEVLKSQKDS